MSTLQSRERIEVGSRANHRICRFACWRWGIGILVISTLSVVHQGRGRTVHEVSVSTVDLDKVESDLLTPLDGFQPFLLVVLEILGSSGDRFGVESLVERSLGWSDHCRVSTIPVKQAADLPLSAQPPCSLGVVEPPCHPSSLAIASVNGGRVLAFRPA